MAFDDHIPEHRDAAAANFYEATQPLAATGPVHIITLQQLLAGTCNLDEDMRPDTLRAAEEFLDKDYVAAVLEIARIRDLDFDEAAATPIAEVADPAPVRDMERDWEAAWGVPLAGGGLMAAVLPMFAIDVVIRPGLVRPGEVIWLDPAAAPGGSAYGRRRPTIVVASAEDAHDVAAHLERYAAAHPRPAAARPE